MHSFTQLSDVKQSSPVDFILTEPLKQKLQLLPSYKDLVLLEAQSVSLDMLQKEFEALSELTQKVSEQDKLTIEEYQLLIMKTMLAYLKRNDKEKSNEIEEKDQLQEPVAAEPVTKWWAKPVYVFLMLFNVLFMAIGGFLGMQEVLLDAIPTLSHFIINLISGCLAACECAMSYSISSPYVKKGLGLPEDEVTRTITMIQDEQRQVTEAINAKLLSPQYYQSMDSSDYSENIWLALLFNDHVSNIQPIEFQEPVFKKRVRLFFTAVNMILIMTNSFYMTTALLKAVAATLVGTPAGWAIIGSVILIQLIATSIMRSESMFEMLNPEVVKIKEAIKRMKSFENKGYDLQYVSTRLKEREDLLLEQERLLLEKRDSSKEFRFCTFKSKSADGSIKRRCSVPTLFSNRQLDYCTTGAPDSAASAVADVPKVKRVTWASHSTILGT